MKDDLISRQAAVDALMVAVNDVGVLDGDDIKVVFEALPSADLKLIAERCIPEECKDDLVSRREVYHLKLMSVTDWDFGQALINMPSAEPEPSDDVYQLWKRAYEAGKRDAESGRKNGKWNLIISILDDMYGRHYCSECGKEGNPFWYFCPNCGADMRGEQDEHID